MLDSLIRPYITPSLDKAAEKIDQYGIPASLITLAGFGLGLVGCFFIAIQSYLFGLIFIAANRLADGLDGAVARRRGPTDFGTYLDLVCDGVIYAAFVFFFVIVQEVHQMAGLFLLLSYAGLSASFLAHALIVYKNGLDTVPGGLVEDTEIMLFMVAACLFPAAFSAIAFLFALLCWISVAMRSMQVWQASSVLEKNYDEAEKI